MVYTRRFLFYIKYDLHPFDRDECINEEKRFDVFLSFSSDDKEHEKALKDYLKLRGYRICDYLKDFIIGENIFDDVENAIICSKRTVYVVTRNFIESKFCMFKFGMAVNVDMLANRKRLIIIMTILRTMICLRN